MTVTYVLDEQTLEELGKGFCVIDLMFEGDRAYDYVVTKVNRAFIAQTGMREAEGRRVTELVPDVDTAWFETLGHVARTGLSRRFEMEVTSTGRWFDVYAFPLDHADTNRLGVIFDDVTDRKKQEAELRRSRQMFQALVTAGAYSAYRMSADWRIMHPLDSDTLEQAAAPIENWVENYIPALDRPEVFAAIRRAIDTKSLFELEHRIYGAEGTEVWVLSRAVPLLDEQGEITEWFGVGSNVTDRRLAAERLRSAEARHRAVLERQVQARTAELNESRDLLRATTDSSLDMIQVFEAVRDDEGSIVDFRWRLTNRAAAGLFGDVVGKSLLENNPGVRAEGIFDTFREVTETGQANQSERYYVHEQFDGWFLQSVVKLGDGVATTTKDITAWKNAQAEVLRLREEVAEARLRESEARFGGLLHGLAQTVWETSPDGRVVVADPSWCRFTGQTPDEMLGYGWLDVVHPDDRADAARVWKDATHTRTDVNMEFRIHSVRANGWCWTNARAVPVILSSGILSKWVGMNIDIHQRRTAEEALRDSEERLRQFGLASSDILWMRDADTLEWTYLTPAFHRVYGLSCDDALKPGNYRRWLDLVHPEDRERAANAVSTVRQGQRTNFDYRIVRPGDGAVRWLRDTDFPIRDDQGRVILIGGIGQDITDIKRAEAQLAESEERLQVAIEVGQVGLWDWNISTGDVYWSDEHFRMQGYEQGEVQPSFDAWLARVHPDDRDVAQERLEHARDAHEDYEAEFRALHPDGNLRWLYARGRFFYDNTGTATRMVGAMIDITERRDLEDSQRILVAELQHRTRNLMGVIRSISDRTALASTDLADYQQRFRGRLDALARVQTLLSRLKDRDRVTFDELIDSQLAALDGEASKVTIAGPKGIRLQSSTVQMLALALHELATNALKYGALSQPDGQLAITWRSESQGDGQRRDLTIDWQESGVILPPDADRRFGQGRELIERALPYQLSAKISYELRAGGLFCRITFPLKRG